MSSSLCARAPAGAMFIPIARVPSSAVRCSTQTSGQRTVASRSSGRAMITASGSETCKAAAFGISSPRVTLK